MVYRTKTQRKIYGTTSEELTDKNYAQLMAEKLLKLKEVSSQYPAKQDMNMALKS